MSLASEPDHPKADIATASNIEAVITVTSVLETEIDQQSSGQQTPIADDAIVVAEPPPPELSPASRPRRARSSLPVYNLSKLTGTDVHGKRKSKGDTVLEKRRRTISDGTTANFGDLDATKLGDALAKASQTTKTEVDASRVKRSSAVLHTPKSARIAKKSSLSPAPAHLTRRATRLSGASAETLASKLSTLSKRGKKAVEKAVSKLPRELLRLKDTNEFAHIDTRPVRYTVWSNGKYIEVDPSQETPAPQPPRKKVKVDEDAVNGEEKPAEEEQKAAAPAVKKPRVKKWLEKGLYAGQEAPLDIFKGLNAQEKKKLAALPELLPSGKPNHTFPQPMYNGLRVLINGRDFKLPFDVCNPLPPGQPKPAAYRTMTKSEFSCQPHGYNMTEC
jgi:histone-lysine N-methyltransferase ASH1L